MCPVKHLTDGYINIIYIVYTSVESKIAVNCQRIHYAVHSLQYKLNVQHILWNTDSKLVCGNSSSYATFACYGLKIGSRSTEYHIASFHIEKLIDNLETADVKISNTVTYITIFLNHACRFCQKCFMIIYASKTVYFNVVAHFTKLNILCGLFHLTPFIFHASHDVMNTATDYCRIIRLGNEVCRSTLHGLNFTINSSLRCGDNNRNLIELFALMHNA